MKGRDLLKETEGHLAWKHITWDGDNRWWVCMAIIPQLDLSDYDKYVMCEAYGWPQGKSWEMDSDGETLVKDWFFNGKLKNPAGVVHDFLNRVPNHTTHDGHTWTCIETNNLYFRIQRALGASLCLAGRRWLGLTISYLTSLLPCVPGWWN